MNDAPSPSHHPIIADLQVAPTGAELPTTIKDCWNTIGVTGDKSCRELPRHGHCHNCPVYSAAAAQFLDRPLTPNYRREWTEHFAQEKKISTPAKTSAIIFRISGEWLGMPTQAFQEIAERRAMHSLPHRRRGIVLGIVNIRGELLICAAIGKLLGLESTTLIKRQLAVFDRLLVANWNGQRFAFPVDEVHGVHRFHSADLREPPATVARSGFNCALGVFPWRNFTVGFLDPESLFAALNRNLS
ncbi:MAG: chemotaxis protein CheW [Verrucomicrobiota bacterium]